MTVSIHFKVPKGPVINNREFGNLERQRQRGK